MPKLTPLDYVNPICLQYDTAPVLRDDFIVQVSQDTYERDHHKYDQYVTGYGAKIRTPLLMVCKDDRIRRVYARCYSNTAMHYVIIQGHKVIVRDYQLDFSYPHGDSDTTQGE